MALHERVVCLHGTRTYSCDWKVDEVETEPFWNMIYSVGEIVSYASNALVVDIAVCLRARALYASCST